MHRILMALVPCLALGCAQIEEDPFLYPDTSVDPVVEADGMGEVPLDLPLDPGLEPDAPVDVAAEDAWDVMDATDAADVADAVDADAGEPCGDAYCASGETCCSSVCVDTDTDMSHCGSCSNVCDTAKANECLAGACSCDGRSACASSSWMKCCTPDGCVDTYHDDDHCGACYNACWFGEWCDFGWCDSP